MTTAAEPLPKSVIDTTTHNWSEKEIHAVAEGLRGHSLKLFEKYGEHRPIAFLFSTRHPTTGELEKGVTPVPVMGGFDEEAKQGFHALVRLIAMGSAAQAVIFISEVWMVNTQNKEDIQKRTGNLGAHPDRREYLMMTVESRQYGSQMWQALITRDAENKPSLGSWERWDNREGAQVTGRFVHLLPPMPGEVDKADHVHFDDEDEDEKAPAATGAPDPPK